MDLPKRKPTRLPNFDYSTPGAYFITICTQDRKNLLGRIVGDGFPVPKRAGTVAENMILRIPQKYPCVVIDKYVVMPNHIHILLRINDVDGTGNPSPTLGNIIGWYKYHATKAIHQCCNTSGTKIFQRSYHDHIIRGARDYLKIWEYIDSNPACWKEDCFLRRIYHELQNLEATFLDLFGHFVPSDAVYRGIVDCLSDPHGIPIPHFYRRYG